MQLRDKLFAAFAAYIAKQIDSSHLLVESLMPSILSCAYKPRGSPGANELHKPAINNIGDSLLFAGQGPTKPAVFYEQSIKTGLSLINAFLIRSLFRCAADFFRCTSSCAKNNSVFRAVHLLYIY
jgi:hypothetical protein